MSLVLMACKARSPAKDDKWETVSSAPNSAKNSTIAPDENIMKGGFTDNLPGGFEQPGDGVGKRMLAEYGSIFVARGGAMPPSVVVFKDEAAVATFQSGVKGTNEKIGGSTVELQAPAMAALKAAVTEATSAGLTITPRGSDASKRDYAGTVTNWASRVDPGLDHWTRNGRITAEDARRIRALSPFEQVSEIFKLEAQGIYFAKDLSKSIIYSVAPPGTSQHLSMLALDVSEHENAKVRQILARHGWYQTVVSDLPHFTFLGVRDTDLPRLGLKKKSDGGRTYWIPDI